MISVEHWKKVLDKQRVRILKEKPISYGVQWIVTDGKDRVPINIYNTGKVVIQGKDCSLKKCLEKIKEDLNEPKSCNRTAKYFVPFEDNLRLALVPLEKSGTKITLEETNDRRILRIRKQNKSLTLNHYSNGTLLVQGLSTDLFELTLEILDRQYGSEHLGELAARYVPHDMREEVISAIGEQGISDLQTGYQPEIVALLPQSEQKLLLTSYHLLRVVKGGLCLPDYTLLVMPMARVLEAFVLRLAIKLGIISEKDFQEREQKVGQLLDDDPSKNPEAPKKLVDVIPKKKRYVLYGLKTAWSGTRNRVMHYGEDSLSLKTPEDAELELSIIHKAIHEAYKLFRDHFPTTPEKSTEINEIKSPKPSAILAKSRNMGIIEARIGIDESGKGDYFGPLVVAAVFVCAEDEPWLSELGVRDSKRLNDGKIADIAKKLFEKLKGNYEIVAIKPKKYNELYEKIKSLNNLLAWGHARALETLLKKVDAKRAISDQFAAPEVLQNALMKQGKTIELIQRPKGEKDLAVATASILARYVFVSRLREMGKHFKVDFPKGAGSDVEKAARAFVENYGREALSGVAKLHFKITERI